MEWDENFDIRGEHQARRWTITDYQVPSRFTGKLSKLTLTIDRPKLSPADVERLKAAQQNNRASK